VITLADLKRVRGGKFGLAEEHTLHLVAQNREPRTVTHVDLQARLIKFEDGTIESVQRRDNRRHLVLVPGRRLVLAADLYSERWERADRDTKVWEEKERERRAAEAAREAAMTPAERFVRDVQAVAKRHGLKVDGEKVKEWVASHE